MPEKKTIGLWAGYILSFVAALAFSGMFGEGSFPSGLMPLVILGLSFIATVLSGSLLVRQLKTPENSLVSGEESIEQLRKSVRREVDERPNRRRPSTPPK